MILADGHQRHEALARVGHLDRYRSGIEVEHRCRIERIAVEPDDGLVVDRRRLAAVKELAEATVLEHVAHVQVGLRAGKVVDGDRHGAAGRRLRQGCIDRRQHCGQERAWCS